MDLDVKEFLIFCINTSNNITLQKVKEHEFMKHPTFWVSLEEHQNQNLPVKPPLSTNFRIPDFNQRLVDYWRKYGEKRQVVKNPGDYKYSKNIGQLVIKFIISIGVPSIEYVMGSA